MELGAPKDTPLKGNPSMMYNNVSSAGGLHCYASQSDIVLVKPLGPHKLPQRDADKAPLTHVGLTNARGRVIVAATSNMVTTLIDGNKEMPLATVQHGADVESRGCALVEFGDRLFGAIGHGTGEVTMVEFGADFTPNVFNKAKAHRQAVSCVAASPSSKAMFVSGDIDGELQFVDNQFNAYVKIPVEGDCVTSVAIFGAYVAASYGSGTIRLFLAETGELRVEISAHSKWINAIAYSPVTNTLASVGEDNLLCLWRMPTATDGRIQFLAYKAIANQLLTGVAFSDDGQSVLCTAFDVDKLHVFPVPQ